MASLSERIKRLERQGVGNELELTVSTREGEARYFKTISGEEIEITESEYNKLAQSARLIEIVFKFTEELEAL